MLTMILPLSLSPYSLTIAVKRVKHCAVRVYYW